MSMELLLVVAAGLVGLLYGALQTQSLMKASPGNERMRDIAAAIQEGASAYLRRQYTTIAMVGVLRVDGALVWSTDHAASVNAGTFVVTPERALEIGTEDHPVPKSVVAKLTFAARTFRDRKHDPFDMAGGLISMGAIRIHGAEKTAWKIPQSQLLSGAREFKFDQPPSN